MAHLEVEHVSKIHVTRRGDPFLALHDVNIQVGKNEFFSIVGPSGCGKTTLLNLIAGFEKPSLGEIRVDGELITEPGWERAVVFQEYALFPWYTIFENVCYGLKRKRVPKAEQKELAEHYIQLVGLARFKTRFPRELSGGMRQRVSIARALAVNPSILLMDEPFGSLDIQTREYMQDELLKIWQCEPKTVIFVTHSIDEAIKLSDKIAIMASSPGRVAEIKVVETERPRDPTDSTMVRLAVEVKEWLRTQISIAEQAAVEAASPVAPG